MSLVGGAELSSAETNQVHQTMASIMIKTINLRQMILFVYRANWNISSRSRSKEALCCAQTRTRLPIVGLEFDIVDYREALINRQFPSEQLFCGQLRLKPSAEFEAPIQFNLKLRGYLVVIEICPLRLMIHKLATYPTKPNS